MTQTKHPQAQSRSVITLASEQFGKANERIRAVFASCNTIELRDVLAQRYLGCGMPRGKRLEIHGVPGNDLGCFMEGGSIEVFGNTQDQVANTMDDGEIIIHGRMGDAGGYGMRGGRILVRDDCGWRVGINMKQYAETFPELVIGGNAGKFLGEYMAGGVIVLLGHPGNYLATGMHGGVIYLAHKLDEAQVMPGLVLEPVDETDRKVISGLLKAYNDAFADELASSVPTTGKGFWRLRPATRRPYAAMYAS
jgi:glutamate synthase domain-containing protein 3